MSNTEKVRKEAILTENELCHAVEYIRLSPSFRDELLRVAQAQIDRLLSDPLVRVLAENQTPPLAPDDSNTYGYLCTPADMLSAGWVKVDSKEEK
uniref:Uncharacterized protein n=1 Tax=viral metagenome TaxID=1070528 RepID=A0A6M3LPM5_9ZZZZ